MKNEYRILYEVSKDPRRLQQDQAALVQILKQSVEQIGRIMRKSPAVLHSGMDEQEAEQLLAKLQQNGIHCRLKIHPVKLSLVLDGEATGEVPGNLSMPRQTCPKCGASNSGGTQCRSCGVFFHKLTQGDEAKTVTEVNTDRPPNKMVEAVSEGLIYFLREWIRNHLVLSAIAGVFLLLFGSKFIAGIILFNKDYHISYDGGTMGRRCADMEAYYAGRTAENSFEHKLSFRYPMKKIVKQYGKKLCIVSYQIIMGNIGSQVIDTAELQFSPAMESHFPQAKPSHHVGHYKRRMPGKRSEKQVQIILKSSHAILLQDLTPGDVVEFRFDAWMPANEKTPDWKRYINKIQVSQRALVEIGDPEVAAFTRFLSNIF